MSENWSRYTPRGGAGIAAGCFVGVGYGLAVGFGRVFCFRRNQCVVVPSTSPFAQDGALAGCFCGVALGAGFGSGVARGVGLAGRLADILAFRLRDADFEMDEEEEAAAAAADERRDDRGGERNASQIRGGRGSGALLSRTVPRIALPRAMRCIAEHEWHASSLLSAITTTTTSCTWYSRKR